MSSLLHRARVLIVGNDDEDFLLALHLLADRSESIVVEHAQSCDQAISCLNSGTYDAIFLDYNLGENSGIQLLDTMRTHGFDIPIIVLVGQGDEQSAANAIKNGASGFLVKSRLTPELAGVAISQALDGKNLRQQEQAVLPTSDQRFRALVERGSAGLSAIGGEGSILYANNATEHILGYPLQEFIGRSIFDFIDPDENLVMQQELRRCVSTPGTPVTVTCRCRHKDGSWVRLEVIATSYLNDPAVNAIVANYRDVTERYRTAQALRESEEKFSKIFNANPLPTAVSRVKDGCCIDANVAFVEMIGLRREQIVGHSILEIGFWLNPQQPAEFIERLQAGERVRDAEIELNAPQRGILRGQISMELIEIGSELCYVSIIRDVTTHKQTEQALIESNEKLRAIIEASPAAITALDAAGIVQIWNPAAEQMYGWTAAEVIGKKLPTVPGEDHSQFLAFRERLLQGENIEPFEATRKRKDGSVLHSLVSLAPLRHSDGGVFGTFSIQLNITRRKVAEEALRESTLELQAAKETAEAATRAKSEFVANMSHEIRTPMNGILGMTELALSTELSSEQREFLGLVKSSADSLMVIINDILDYSKIEAGKLALDPINFNLRDTLGDIMKVMTIAARQKGLELTCHVQPSVPLELVGDTSRLRQVILNLMGNAIKFTAQGEVALSVSVAERSEQGLTLNFAIRDTGVGIPAEKQDKIFHAFEQADGSTTRRYGGTGLGLAISTRILQLMGGKIWVESTPGEGSTFHFTAQFTLVDHQGTVPVFTGLEDLLGPLALQEGPATPLMEDADQQPQESMRILLVEDNQVNQKLAATMLEKMGHTVVQTSTGKDAVERCGQHHFDLVFMDVQMPEMDGFEATQEIRSREKWTGAHVPIVAMTANTMSGDRERCLQSGMDDYVGKPITRSELLRVVGKYGPQSVREPDTTNTTAEGPGGNNGPRTDLSAPARS